MTAVTRRGILVAGALLAVRPRLALAASESERLNEWRASVPGSGA